MSYCVWRVSEVRNPHKTLSGAIKEATNIVRGEERDVVILQTVKTVQLKPVKVIVQNYK